MTTGTFLIVKPWSSVAPHASSSPSPSQIFTDGCGFINGGALRLISHVLTGREPPTAVQGRIMGAKGLWLLHPDKQHQDPHETPHLWIRKSQRKITLPPDPHPSHLIFDLVAPSRVSTPCRVSKLVLMNLSHNGVASKVFCKLMKASLQNEVAALTQWSDDASIVLLYHTIDRLGHVSMGRIHKFAGGQARAYGLGGGWQDELLEADNTDQSNAHSASSPSHHTIHSQTLALLRARFHPLRLPYLFDKIKVILQQVLKSCLEDLRITVPLSAEAFIVPGNFRCDILYMFWRANTFRSVWRSTRARNPLQIVDSSSRSFWWRSDPNIIIGRSPRTLVTLKFMTNVSWNGHYRFIAILFDCQATYRRFLYLEWHWCYSDKVLCTPGHSSFTSGTSQLLGRNSCTC